METLPVTSGSQWRKNREEGELIQLPYSGYLVRIRTVRPDALLRLGKIPQVLTTLMLDLIYDRGEDDQFEKFLTTPEDQQEAINMLDSLKIVCTAGLISPKIVDEPVGDDEITIEDMDLGDRSFIFRLVFAPAEALSRFRPGSPADVDVVSNGISEPQPSL
jgi:hypothetical protein